MATQTIPVIDVQSLRPENANRSEVVDRIGIACSEWGFFQIIGHPIPAELISRIWRVTRQFFSLPVEAKAGVSRSKENARGWYNRELTKNCRDMKEVFDFGCVPHPELPDEDPKNRTPDGFNRWPDPCLCSDFRPTLWEYYRACERLAFILLEAIGESLSLPYGRLSGDFRDTHTSFLRLNFFPLQGPLRTNHPSSQTGHLGIHHHTDAGALTVLLQDEVGGLEVCLNHQWFPVEPVAGALVINIGDIVQVWSNDRYRAPLHRVLPSENRDRYSLPFFFNPSYDAEYAPLPELTNDTSPPRYRSIKWSEFRWKRQQGDFANYGAENQIADYCIATVGESGTSL